MLTIRLVGGLCNQAFQYAFGRSLMKKHSVQFMDHCGQYGLGLGAFNTSVQLTNRPEGPARSEKSLLYDPSEQIVEDPSVLYGYWQCEKYFLDVETEIRQEMTLRGNLSDKAQSIAQQISVTPNSVMLHIRRGDYLTWAREVHGVLPMEYYLRAAQHISERAENLNFFVFSDDPVWVQHSFRLSYPVTVVNTTPHEDLILMSKCKHAIIANSSFSWWGAWLGPDKTGVVIAPQQWFAQGNENSRDIIPGRWTRI